MMKFIKEIFSAENLKKAMVYASLASPTISPTEFVHLSNILKSMDAKNINNEVNIKKVA